MADLARSPRWSDVVVHPRRVVVYEDVARKGMLTLRWWDAGAGQWKRETLGRRLRRDASGAPDAEDVAFAKTAAMKKALVLAGEVPAAAPAAAAPVLLTIGATKPLLIDAETGKYPHATPHRSEVLRSLAYAATVWGVDTPWVAITDEHWLQLLRRRLRSLVEQGYSGVRRTEIVLRDVHTVAEWLRLRKKIPTDAAHRPKGWKDEIVAYWRGLTKADENPTPNRPRHTLDDFRKILDAAWTVDERLALLLALGAEYRGGQVVRCKRSKLDLAAGTLTVPGAGKKQGARIRLTAGQRAACERVLAGLYATLEAAYQAEGTDYPLFPAGKPVTQRSGQRVLGKRGTTGRYMSKRQLIRLFHDAEAAAGVATVPGRALYGLRRANVDAVNSEGISERGLMAAGGWADITIPHAIYAEKENVEGELEAMRVRAKIRGEATPAEAERTPPVHNDDPTTVHDAEPTDDDDANS